MQHDLIRLQHMLDAGKDALQFAWQTIKSDLSDLLKSIEKILK
jgi:hypothetical protein